MNFKLQLLADGDNVAADAQSGIVNSALSLIKKLNVKMSSVDVYDCQDANQATNIKNLLEYSKGYSESQGKNEFFYLDTVRNTGINKVGTLNIDAGGGAVAIPIAANYNSGFAVRKAQLVDNAVVNAQIPLNRYSFFESLHGEILPIGYTN